MVDAGISGMLWAVYYLIFGRFCPLIIAHYVHDAIQIASLEKWAKKNLRKTDIVVMEAGSNIFEVCRILQTDGFHAVVLESFQASRIGENYLKNDRVDAVKLARVYLSGLAKTVRGPVLSTFYGKIQIMGVSQIQGEKVFTLMFIEGRNPEWVLRPFYARYDEKAIWFDAPASERSINKSTSSA